MDHSLSGKRFVLFGGSGGIGSKVAERLSARGASLLLVGRNEATLREVSGRLGAEYALADVTRPEEVDRICEAAAQGAEPVVGTALLVGSILLKPLHLTRIEEWEQTIRINATAAFAVLKGAVQHLMPQGGSVVLMSSAAARIGLPNHEAIAAAKGAVEGLALASAATYVSRGLRVNCVAPGLVRTPLSSKITASPAGEKASLAMHPLGRLGEPEDVASMVELLLDPSSSWITGQVFVVDGGLSSLKGRQD